MTEGDDIEKYVVVFQSRKLAGEYIQSHPSAPHLIVTIETPYDAITAFQTFLGAGFKGLLFFVGDGHPAPVILLSDVLQQVRQTVAAQVDGDESPRLPQAGRKPAT